MEQRNTKIFSIKNQASAKKYIQKAAEIIREGGLVCFPTETVYGLGADATNDKAVADIFRAKNRSFENPIALHLSGVEEIEKYVKNINKRARILMEKFLPGPLMLIFEKNEKVSNIVTGGLRKVGIRVPRHKLCLEFLKECNTPVAATSANKSGRLSCVKPTDILEELGGKIDVILDGGKSPFGIESTVLDVTGDPPRIIRPGFITLEEIAVAIGIPPILSHNIIKSTTPITSSEEEPRVILLEGEASCLIRKLKSYVNIYKDKKVGVILTDGTFEKIGKELDNVRKMGPAHKPAFIARNIFEILKEFERNKFDVVIVEGIPRKGLGRTLMIKLERISKEVIKLMEDKNTEDR